MSNSERDLQAKRQIQLDSEWDSMMPCTHCAISEVCKYRSVIKRPDYPKSVFDIKITCKIQHKFVPKEPEIVPRTSKEEEDKEFVRHMNLGV